MALSGDKYRWAATSSVYLYHAMPIDDNRRQSALNDVQSDSLRSLSTRSGVFAVFITMTYIVPRFAFPP